MNKQQTIKKYFGEYPLHVRKAFSQQTTDENVEAFCLQMLEIVKKQQAKDMPILLNSIMYNSLGFEYNEKLKDTCYSSYQNKHITKFAKPFINGQYQIFRNPNEAIILNDGDNVNDIINRLENTIAFLVQGSVDNTLNLHDYALANSINPNAVNGIIKKVIKDAGNKK